MNLWQEPIFSLLPFNGKDNSAAKLYGVGALGVGVMNAGFGGRFHDFQASELLGEPDIAGKKGSVDESAYVGIAPIERAMRRQSSA